MTWLCGLRLSLLCLAVGHRPESIFLHHQNKDLIKVAGTTRNGPLHGMRQRELLQQGSETDMQRILALKPDGSNKRPVLSVYLMNGLGNQLFQISALLALALENNPKFSVALPNVEHVCCNRTTYWHTVFRRLKFLLQDGLQEDSGHAWSVGSLAEFLGLSEARSRYHFNSSGATCQLKQLSKFNPWDKDCRKATTFNATWASRLESLNGCSTIMLSGYFQNQEFFSRHLSFLQRLFWDDASAERARKHLDALTSKRNGKPLVSIHYRLGDYEPNGWVLSDEYYNQGLSEVGKRFGQQPFCLFFFR